MYCTNNVVYTEWQIWPWPLTPWAKIERVFSLIIHSLHVKFESDWAKTVAAIVSTRYYTQSAKVDLELRPLDTNFIEFFIHKLHVEFESDWAKTVVAIKSTRSYTQSATVDLDLWPRDPKSIGFLLSSSQQTYEVWKWLDKNCSRYRVHKVLYTEYHSWPWPLTPWPKINRVSPLTIRNLHVKFESDRSKTVVAVMSTRSHTQSATVDLDLDLWPCDPKSIGFLLSSSTTNR